MARREIQRVFDCCLAGEDYFWIAAEYRNLYFGMGYLIECPVGTAFGDCGNASADGL